MQLTQAERNGFYQAAQSLKLYRRAEIQAPDGDSLVDELYVDPQPNDQTLSTVLLPNTAFLIGRKGTEKSPKAISRNFLRRRK